VANIDDRIAELVRLTEGTAGSVQPPFSLKRHATSEATGKVHVEQLAFMRDRSHRIHCMCARQAGKSQGDAGILMDAGLFQPYSTNVILGFNGPHIRMNNWEPIWKRMFDKYSGLDPAWRNEARMVTTFANRSRVIMAGTDDSRYIKNILGGRVENGVFIVDESQDQPVLDELLDSILPPMMGANARLILSGVFPEAPVGRFWRESGWVERDGQWVQEQSRGWSRHNWGRLANVHLSDSWQVLQRYLADTGLTINDQQIIRDWQGKPAFDPNVTAYRYDRARNGYAPQMPDWLRMVYAQQKDDRGRDLKFAHEMRPDKDGVLHGMMAAEPMFGVRIFSLALDPGATSDAASIQGFGWGPDFRGAQHLFDWTTLRKSHVSTGDMFAVLGLAYKAFLRWGEAMNPRYDAGSSQNTIDNLQNDYGLPLVLAAKKNDLIGQVNRFNDLMTEAKLKVMHGSAMEQDLLRARWNKAALERHQREWDRSHHPNASEAGRYAIQDYFEAAVPKQTGPGTGYGYQDPIATSRPTVSYNQITGTGEAYGGGNAYGSGETGGGGGYGGPWGQ
jgi:hypothetical protein